VLLAEANQWPEDVAAYFGGGHECHMAHHFGLMPRICMAIAQEDRFPITDILRQTPDIPVNCQWATFLRNHDELTLEMVTDIERDYLWSTYATDPRARLNLGIRRRLASLMDNERRKIELMNSLLMSFPGTPIIYYGDEIGMGDYRPAHESCWSAHLATGPCSWHHLDHDPDAVVFAELAQSG
jgi:maltose alpha-D-glucosyltransferase/alpha-amylase